MIKITEKMRSFIREQNNLVYVGTCDENMRPNIVPKAILGVGESSLIYANLFMDKTSENIHQNNQISISTIDPSQCSGYQFKGRAEIITRGAPFEFASKRFGELGFDEPIHAIELEVDEVFYFEQGPESKLEAA